MEEWTKGRLRSFITSTLRAGFRKFPDKYKALNKAKRGKKLNKATNRLAEHYLCNSCKQEFVLKNINVDHINPVVDPKVGFIDWNTFIDRLFCGVENLQILCSSCHDRKTKKETSVRTTIRKATK